MLRPLLKQVDHGIERLFWLAGHLPPLDLLGFGLSAHRQRVAAQVLERARPEVVALTPAVQRREAAAVERYDALVAGCLEELRGACAPGLLRALSQIDQRFYKDAPELLDDDSFPMAERVHLIDRLDDFNRAMGNYAAWGEFIATQLLDAHGGRRLCELTAGHGGFAVALKEQLGDRVEVWATDLKDEYLDLGRARAQHVDVRFVAQDATDLSPLEGAGIDYFLSTQSVHHFPPGMLARILGEAARCARRGLCFIDAERGLLPYLLFSPLMGAYGRSYVVLHDSAASLRRMYFTEELALLAALAPGLCAAPGAAPRHRIDAQRRGPGYCYLVVTPG